MSNESLFIGFAVLAFIYFGYFCWAVKYRNGKKSAHELNTVGVLEPLDSDK